MTQDQKTRPLTRPVARSPLPKPLRLSGISFAPDAETLRKIDKLDQDCLRALRRFLMEVDR